ncbi:GCN5-related N-acetyltransferase [Usnea florida]
MDDYTIIHTTPSVEDYISLRTLAGLTPKTAHAATVGLANTLFAVQIVQSYPKTTIVGMGRMIGDGGCFFQIVDIAVLPAHQHKGLGKMIMKELKHWMDKNIPESGNVFLFADGRANELYKQFGFVETSGLTPTSVGMVYRD